LESTQGALDVSASAAVTTAVTPALDADLAASEAAPPASDAATAATAIPATRTCALPTHLPRECVRYEPLPNNTCGCTHCGATQSHMTHLGDDESETLEYVPGRFKVVTHVRPKYACSTCHTINQAAAPSRPLARSYAGAGLLAHVLTSKYADHLPLYRQSEIYSREGATSPAPHWPIGWAAVRGSLTPWWMPCSAMCWQAQSCMPTTLPYRYCNPGAAPLRWVGCGLRAFIRQNT
jgi:transposase